MQIQFKNVIPEPLAGITDPTSEIWQKQVTFEPNTKYQIYAPSGKGKSTFTHLIYGLRNDFSGEITLDGKEVNTITKTEWATLRQQNMAIVFQDLRLFLNLTAWENIQVKSVLREEDKKAQIKEMADFLGVSRLLEKKTVFLSYGERQRIAIIRALIQPFDFLLLDEPFSHLDEENIKKACQLIEEKRLENKASLLMTSLGFPYFLNFDKKLLL